MVKLRSPLAEGTRHHWCLSGHPYTILSTLESRGSMGLPLVHLMVGREQMCLPMGGAPPGVVELAGLEAQWNEASHNLRAIVFME